MGMEWALSHCIFLFTFLLCLRQVALAALELAIYLDQAGLCLLSVGIKSICYHT